jgi:hypothetical protein
MYIHLYTYTESDLEGNTLSSPLLPHSPEVEVYGSTSAGFTIPAMKEASSSSSTSSSHSESATSLQKEEEGCGDGGAAWRLKIDR